MAGIRPCAASPASATDCHHTPIWVSPRTRRALSAARLAIPTTCGTSVPGSAGWRARARIFETAATFLVGHSAGATLALQVLMGDAPEAGNRPPLPAAIIGFRGIYDLTGLNARFDGAYAGFISAAFGAERGCWRRASPALFSGSFRSSWPGGAFILLARSPDDDLVDDAETQAMAAKLADDGVDVSVTALTGHHDSVWQDGTQVAMLVTRALSRLQAD